jgi:hypothetical protein
MDDEDGSFEAELRETNPQEAERLNALLRGEFPPDRYPTDTPDNSAFGINGSNQGFHWLGHMI